MALNLPNLHLTQLPFTRPKEVLAIDLGTHSIKILQLKQTGANKFSLVKWGILQISDNAQELSPNDRKNFSAQKLSDYLAKEKILQKNVVSSVSGNQVIVRYVKLLKNTRDVLMKTISQEAEPYIPFDVREVNLSFHILNDVVEDGQKKMETILVAAKNEIVQMKLDVFNELNLRPIIMDVDSFAIQNTYEMCSDREIEENVLLVNIGASVTNLVVVEKMIPRVVRDIFISGTSFTKSIQRNLACDAKTAEELKARYSILVTAEEKEKTLAENQKEALQVSTAILPIARDLSTEIHRSIEFYSSQNPDKQINRVLLSGGSANLKNLTNYLSQELKLPVEILDPFKNVAQADSIPDSIRSNFVVAVGLALRKENDIPKK